MVTFKTTIRGKNSKGGDRLQLYLNPEMTRVVIDALTATLENDTGAKLDIHTSVKTTNEGGRKFDSSIAFVKPIQPKEGTGASVKFVPKSDLSEKIAKVKKEIA